LVVRLGSLSLDILLDSIDLRLISNKSLLNIVESLIDVMLQDHVPSSVMFHGMVSRLLGQSNLVLSNHLLDINKFLLFSFMLSLKLTYLGELVLHFISHPINILLIGVHFFVHSAFKILDLFKILGSGLNLNLQLSSGTLCIVELSLLEVKIFLHIFDSRLIWKSVLSCQIL